MSNFECLLIKVNNNRLNNSSVVLYSDTSDMHLKHNIMPEKFTTGDTRYLNPSLLYLQKVKSVPISHKEDNSIFLPLVLKLIILYQISGFI